MNPLAELAQLLAHTNDPRLVEAVLNALLTPSEAHDLNARWELVKRLDQGETQRQIAKELHLSLCKITRGSRELKKPDSALKALLKLRQQGATER
jgi:TrpR family transcriptional regulator, trp operon repressor